MEHKGSFFSFFCLLSLAVPFTEAHNYSGNGFGKGIYPVRNLFVFGDSYADTGNLPTSVSISWKEPYGITFPGKPSGRFSDGRLLTDYIASYLNIRSPSPYRVISNGSDMDTNTIQYGINFAYGGTGVFETLVDQPNMTTQIDFFQQLILKNVFATQDLSSSVALVSLAGNDYAAYLAKNGSFQELPNFTRSVINQLILNVRRIKELGIKKIAVTGLTPLGCLPINSASSSYTNCNGDQNNFSESHNLLLKQNIMALNQGSAAPIFVYLDLYSAFSSVLQIQHNPSGNLRNKLKPCCVGAKGEDCGLVDNNGTKKYLLCENPKQSFYWDSVHPSNAGWRSVYEALEHTLHSLRLL